MDILDTYTARQDLTIEPVDLDICAKEINAVLEKGVFLTTKTGEGAQAKVNSMVIGWGHVGVIWARSVFIAYIRTNRYTYEMLQGNPEFTINVPTYNLEHGPEREKLQRAFAICGSKSGRDIDKIAEAGLTLVAPEKISVPAILEFPLTLECRVCFTQLLPSDGLPDKLRKQFYTADPSEHVAFFGEIVSAYRLKQ